jgi:hypothetical protein
MTTTLHSNNAPPPKRKFFYLKVKTGETLLSEIRAFLKDDNGFDSIILYRPIQVKDYVVGPAEGVLSGEPWTPYTDAKNIPIGRDMVYSMGPLNEEWMKFYGNSLLKQEILALQKSGNAKLNGDKFEDYFRWLETYNAMVDIGAKYQAEFGVKPPSFEEFKKEVDKKKPKFH